MSWSEGDEYRICDRCGQLQLNGSYPRAAGWFWAANNDGVFYHQCPGCGRRPDKCRDDVRMELLDSGFIDGPDYRDGGYRDDSY